MCRYSECQEFRPLATKEIGVADAKLISALKSLPADYWDFKNEDVHEYTHGIHNYPAMMVCPISRNIIRIVKEIMPVESLLDPFAGSGTVLVEGMLAGIQNVCGNDMNPLAVLLCKVKTTPLDVDELKREADNLTERIKNRYYDCQLQVDGVDDVIQNAYKLDLTAKQGWGEGAPDYLRKYVGDNYLDIEVPDFRNIGYWFKPRAILLLSLIKTEILKVHNEDIRDFIFVAFSETIRFVSNRRNGEFKMFRMPPAKVEAFKPEVIGTFTNILQRNIGKMNDFVKRYEMTFPKSKVTVYRGDSCTLMDIPDDSVDLVITSPPYGDSRTTVAYGEYSRLSLQWLNLDNLSEKEIMGIDRSLMGGTKHTDWFESDIKSDTLKKSLSVIRDIDFKRAGDVYSFYCDLDKSISTISQKTREAGYQFWVVGNRTVKGEILRTDVIIAELATQYDMEYVYTIDRNIVNKTMPSLNSPTNEVGQKSSTMTNERIVVLRKK
ncbi:MAG: hypothetical protein LIO49_07375 [Ruminococcus sp.]|nr:hypothetical protein [Ruminococcus sp.]